MTCWRATRGRGHPSCHQSSRKVGAGGKEAMKRTRILVAAGALVALTTAGCTGPVSGAAAPGGSGQPDVPTVRSTAPTEPTQSTVPTGPAEPGASSMPPRTGQEPIDPALSSDCKAADLTLAIGRGEGTAGTLFRPFRFTN